MRLGDDSEGFNGKPERGTSVVRSNWWRKRRTQTIIVHGSAMSEAARRGYAIPEEFITRVVEPAKAVTWMDEATMKERRDYGAKRGWG